MKNQCGMSSVEKGASRARSSAKRALSIPHSPFSIRSGVTLIELLITMTIMAIIAAAILGTAAAAIESAREKRTQSLITKINALVMDHLATYETRRVEINQTWINVIDAANPSPKVRSQWMADLRLLALRELMKYEMPENLSNIRENPVFLQRRPPLAERYLRHFVGANNQNVGAECLYIFVMSATGDGEARTLFAKQDLGDADRDGADGLPEFVDGWGNAIEFLRWPAGYFVNSPLMSGDGNADHDPFDPYRRDDPKALPLLASYPSALQPYVRGLKDDHPAFRLVPLIMSFGPNGADEGDVDIYLSRGKDVTSTASDMPALNPYFIASDVGPSATRLSVPAYGYGLPDLTDGVDDTKNYITNHLIEY